MTASDFFSRFGATLKSSAKLALLCRPTSMQKTLRGNQPIIILANGPSLNQTISESLPLLKSAVTMSVNFAPLAQVFFDIRPKYHVLADPLFFDDNKTENINRLYQALEQVDWPLTLLIPNKFARKLPQHVILNPNISVSTFNFVGAEGFRWFEHFAFSRRLAMPRPRNVLIPAIMSAIWLGYQNIYIVGADHSWMQSISVDSQNNVISVQPHFYKDDKTEQKRVDSTYRNYRLHDIVHSFYIAFRSYHSLQDFAKKKNINIINSTPSSYIDAFPRAPLPSFDSPENP